MDNKFYGRRRHLHLPFRLELCSWILGALGSWILNLSIRFVSMWVSLLCMLKFLSQIGCWISVDYQLYQIACCRCSTLNMVLHLFWLLLLRLLLCTFLHPKQMSILFNRSFPSIHRLLTSLINIHPVVMLQIKDSLVFDHPGDFCFDCLQLELWTIVLTSLLIPLVVVMVSIHASVILGYAYIHWDHVNPRVCEGFLGCDINKTMWH